MLGEADWDVRWRGDGSWEGGWWGVDFGGGHVYFVIGLDGGMVGGLVDCDTGAVFVAVCCFVWRRCHWVVIGVGETGSTALSCISYLDLVRRSRLRRATGADD